MGTPLDGWRQPAGYLPTGGERFFIDEGCSSCGLDNGRKSGLVEPQWL
jgi:hypothetical protein